MPNVTEIKGRECLKIQETPIVKLYQHTTEDSPLKGKSYRIYTYLGKAFAVNTEDSFCDLQKSGKIATVSLDINADGQYSLVGKTSKSQELECARFDAELASITVENYKPQVFNAAMANDIS